MARVLIVESNTPMADFVAKTLAAAGHETMATASRSEALAMIQERRPDLTLVNYFLAEGDGLAFLDALGRVAPGAAAVMTTGLGNEILAREAMRLGALDYVIKGPEYFRDLPALVDERLRLHALAERRRSAAELSGRLAAQAQLAGWVDHNLKNILSAAMGSLSLIDPSDPDQSSEKRQEYLADGLGSLKAAMRLLEDLSRVTRAGGGEDAAECLVASVVDETWRSLAGRLRGGRDEDFAASPAILETVSFINDTRSLPPLRIVGRDLATVLDILLKNSIEAVGRSPDPRIVVRAGVDGEMLTMSVEDNGRGMDERVRRHAFEPLFSTKGKVGVGLSLTTVLALVNRHQGEVKLTSEAGRGALMELTWRLAPS